MNTYVNIAKHKGPKKKKDLRANCGKNTNKNNLFHGKICTFTSLCSNEKKHPIQKKCPAYCFVFKDCITAECL